MKSFGKKVLGFVVSDKFQEISSAAYTAVSLVAGLAPNRKLNQVVDIYTKYGLPLSKSLKDGLSEEEVKMLMAQAATLIVQRQTGANTTDAQLAVHAAFKDQYNK